MQRESDYAVPKGGECQREPLVEEKVAIRKAATHGRLGLTEIQAAAAAGRERAALWPFLEGAGGVVADDALDEGQLLREIGFHLSRGLAVRS